MDINQARQLFSEVMTAKGWSPVSTTGMVMWSDGRSYCRPAYHRQDGQIVEVFAHVTTAEGMVISQNTLSEL